MFNRGLGVKVAWGLILGVFALVLLTTSSVYAQEKIKIGIILFNDIPPFMDAAKGFKQELADNGYGEDKVEYLTYNAKSDMGLLKGITDELRNANVKIIVITSTGGTIEVLKNVQDIPVVFAVVAYLESINDAAVKFGGFGSNYTGAIISASADRIIELALKTDASIKKVGFLRNGLEDNSRRDVNNFEASCKKMGIQVVSVPFASDAEVVPAFQKLVLTGVKCVFLPKDTLQQKHLEEFKALIYSNKIFGITSELAIVPTGAAMLGLSAVPFDVGVLAGNKALQILKGRKPNQIAIEPPKDYEVWLNIGSATKSGVNFPVGIIKLANKVITD
ncbi:MAG: ABC transporter substrate-binding protein [Candidatus Omnitrophota bacterium]